MQKPSIGRIVLFTEGDIDHAAIITRVHSDTCVNLKVFPDAGEIFARTSVLSDPQKRLNPRWSWPDRV